MGFSKSANGTARAPIKPMSCRLLLVALMALTPLYSADVEITRVIGISDGDTIKIFHEGVPKRIRLHGIDCPESGQPFSTKAKQFTADLAFEKTVKLIVKNTDRQRKTCFVGKKEYLVERCSRHHPCTRWLLDSRVTTVAVCT
jgi:endonuclease YncB( thermonuclease family)